MGNLSQSLKKIPVLVWIVIGILLIGIPFAAWQVLGRNTTQDLSSFMYLYGIDHTGLISSDSPWSASSITKLRSAWQAKTGSPISVQPIIYNNNMYWGGWDGYFHSSTLAGKDEWKTNLGTTTVVDCDPPNSVGIASSPALADIQSSGNTKEAVIVGGGNSALYALDTKSGQVIWKSQIGTPPNEFLWSSPVIYNGSVYIGMASFGDCPLVAGKVIKVDVNTGKILNTFVTVPSGCNGSTVWSTPTIDKSKNSVYISTGNMGKCATAENYGDSVVELSASDLSVIGSWQIPPQNQDVDSDFGATPTLFEANNQPMVGVVSKDGVYYAFKRDNLSLGPVWQKQIAVQGDCVECADGSISTSAWDGTTLYAAGGKTTINGNTCQGSVRGLSPVDGSAIWEYCDQSDPVISGLTVSNDLVIVPVGGSIVFLNKRDGSLVHKETPNAVSSMFASPPAISPGLMVFGNLDGNLFAYSL